MINSVESEFGHRFMSGSSYNDDGEESCLTCGAKFLLILNTRPGALSTGRYVANGGDQPMSCTRDTGMIHAYPGERHCWECDPGEPCKHVTHQCNCLRCS